MFLFFKKKQTCFISYQIKEYKFEIGDEKILTGNQRLLKNLNNNVILNLVRTRSPISGASLAKITGMRPSTVQNILKNLEKKGLVQKDGIGDSTKFGGRRPTLWTICGNYGYVVGIQLEINEIQAVLVNLNSQIIAENKISIRKFNTISDIEQKIIEIIENILSVKNIHQRQLLGVGIGASGLVDSLNGIIIKTSLLSSSLQPIYLEKTLRTHFDIPIYIENDANAAVLAEKWFGKAQGIKNVIFTLAIINKDVFGIGFGLILNNDLYRGANMFAGEIEPHDLNVKKMLVYFCNYNKKHFKVGNQIVKTDELMLHHLIGALDYRNKDAIHFFYEIGELIADELLRVINLLDPELIVIGGEFSKAKEFVLNPIRKKIQEQLSLTNHRKFEIVSSLLPENSVALGAATIILQKIFHKPVLN